MSQYDFTKSPVSLDRLTKEIQDSSIVTALDHINYSGSDLQIFFKAELSSEDETTLEGLVEDHTGEPLPENVVTNVKVVEDLVPKDTDGSPLNRVKVTKSGWHYQLHSMEFSTSKRAADYSKHVNGDNIGFVAMKCYDAQDQEITDDNNLGNAVKTVVSWEPNHDIDIIGALFYQSEIPEEDIRMWTIGVPDVPAEYGGSKPFVTGGVNLKFLGTGQALLVDGRAPKSLTYSATYHTTKFNMVFKHPAGVVHPIMMVFELFKA